MLHAVLFAATLIADVKGGELKVNQVQDHRSKSFGRLMVGVQLPSVKTTDVAASRVLLKAAVDDGGNNLLMSDEEPKLEPNMRRSFADPNEPPVPMVVSIEMKNPARTAKAIKDVRGEIELYIPGRDPNSTATVQKFMSQSGRSINDRALKSNSVEISLLSKDQFEAMKKAALDKYRAEKSANGLTGDDLDEAVKSYAQYDYLNPEEGDVLVKVNDPKKVVQAITYVDAKGEEKRVNVTEKNGITVLSTWGEKPADDWALRVNMRTPKTLVRVPLALSNVPLP